jgi:GST-like protein
MAPWACRLDHRHPPRLREVAMLEVYTAQTPNGIKVPIALEELGLPYRIVPVDLLAGAQRAPAFLALNPNGRIPVLVDREAPGGPLCLAESGAILLHLAETAGQLMPAGRHARAEALHWLFLQVSSIGPVFGTLRALSREPSGAAVAARFSDEAQRLLALVERRLASAPWLAGDAYSIADIACFGWLRAADYAGIGVGAAGNVARWLDRIDARPAVQRALATLARAIAAQAA